MEFIAAAALAAAALGVFAAWFWSRRYRALAAVVTTAAGDETKPEQAAQRLLEEAAAEQAAAEERRRRLEAALEASEAGVVIIDDQGIVLFVNEAATGYIAARPGEAVAEIRLKEAMETALNNRERVAAEVELGPARRTLAINASPVGGNQAAVAYMRDITVQRRTEAMRTDFIANASHELRTPASAIEALAETAADHLDEPEVANRMVQLLHAESRRLSTLVEDLLDLSAIEAGVSGRDTVSVAQLIKTASENSSTAAAAAGIELIAEEVAPGVTIAGDRTLLQSMLTNLLDNAIRYSRAAEGGQPPRVWIRASSQYGEVKIQVEDEGIGISEVHLDRVFERFYRVDRARSRSTGGTGLGLSIVRHVAAAHGGDVAVSSRLGEGSTFTVTLPARP